MILMIVHVAPLAKSVHTYPTSWPVEMSVSQKT